MEGDASSRMTSGLLRSAAHKSLTVTNLAEPGRRKSPRVPVVVRLAQSVLANQSGSVSGYNATTPDHPGGRCAGCTALPVVSGLPKPGKVRDIELQSGRLPV